MIEKYWQESISFVGIFDNFKKKTTKLAIEKSGKM